MSDQANLTEQLSKDQGLQRDQVVSDLEVVLRLPQGRRVLLRILEVCGVYRTAFTGDRATTDLRLGEQNIGLWLIAQLDLVDLTEYPRLILERAQRKAEDKGTGNVAVLDEE
jgi:hypothetical protein